MAQNPIKIHALGLDERGVNTLSFFFQKFCIDRCEMVVEDQAEVFMINMDSVGADQKLAALKADSPMSPIILMALYSIEAAPHYFVRKPLIAEHLLTILTDIEQLPNRKINQNYHVKDVDEEVEEIEPQKSGSVDIDTSKLASLRLVASTTNAATKLSQTELVHFVGNRADVDLLDEKNTAAIYFDPKRYYLGHVQEAIELAKEKNCSIQMSGLSHTLYLSPNLNLVYVELSDHKLRYYGITALYNKTAAVRKRDKFSYQFLEDDDVKELCDKQAKYEQNLQSFLWKLSLWTSRGRLPVGVALDVPVYIDSWPNFTRLTEIPHALRIVASWIPHPKSIIQMTENLPIPQRSIFSFFTATYMIGLSGVSEKDADILIIPTESTKNNDTKSEKHRGFFSRLMKKLTTG